MRIVKCTDLRSSPQRVDDKDVTLQSFVGLALVYYETNVALFWLHLQK